MTERRVWIVSIGVTVFIASHFVFWATGEQHWPILTFPMYATTTEEVSRCPVIYAVPADPGAPEFRLTGDHTGIDDTATGFALKKLVRYPHRSPRYAKLAADCTTERCASDRLVRAALADLYDRYEQQRAEDPKRPVLKALVVYDIGYAWTGQTFTIASKQPIVEWTRP